MGKWDPCKALWFPCDGESERTRGRWEVGIGLDTGRWDVVVVLRRVGVLGR